MKDWIEFHKVSKIYGSEEAQIKALDDVSFTIEKGSFTVILGPSGAGKSTILNLLGGMDQVSHGEIIVNKQRITDLKEQALATYRAQQVGFVFQFYNLIPTLSAYENVALMKELTKQALNPQQVLQDVGLGKHLHKFPSALSGGEQQRVSIARAIAKNPSLLLCDEPTGALDSQTGCTILQLLLDLVKQKQCTVVIVTHNAAIAQIADRIIHMKNGEIASIHDQPYPRSINEVNW